MSHSACIFRRESIPSLAVKDLVPLRLEAIHTLRHLRQGRDAEPLTKAFALIANIIVRDGRVCRNAVVPQGNSPVIPLDTRLDVLALGNMLQRDYISIIQRVRGQKFERTLYSNCRMASDSSSFNPTIRRVNPGLTKRTFCFVTGCTRTMG